MTQERGFSLIELLIVVAIVGIIVAIAVPSLLKARMSANESAAQADSRSVNSANAAYHARNMNTYASGLACMSSPASCGWRSSIPFLDSNIASADVQTKQGYDRNYQAGAAKAPSTAADTAGVDSYTYACDPANFGLTGEQSYCIAADGMLCFSNGAPVGTTGGPGTAGLGCLPGCSPVG